MRIVFVRHGDPDYVHDCLTEVGRQQAEAAAERLLSEGIERIYSSPNGRAQETAGCLAKRLDLPINTLDYMHEIEWGGPDLPMRGHPWTLSQMMISEGFDFASEDWTQHPYFAKNVALDYYRRLETAFDGFMEAQGYRHEGGRFYCTAEKDETIAIFSHGGSGACVLSNVLNLPFPYLCGVMPYEVTSVTILEFPFRPNEWICPVIELFNDAAHIGRPKKTPFYGR